MPSRLPADSVPLLDFHRLQLVADTEQVQAALIALFFRLAGELTSAMENAAGGEEWRNAAHSLKGSAANLGMAGLETLCRQAEKTIDRTLLARIREELECIRNYIAAQNPA